ncbi:lipopolysaccharide biosynthesis protein [Pseudoclavibacter sp. Marseille-Q4354]|nr:lipopolysaccharide biosynthesis protein [Pseudoclavibacter sp. Marseille-Q4354]
MNIASKAVTGMGWAAVEKWSSRLVSLLVLLVLGRLLTPADFGLVALGTVFMTFLNVFVDQGFGRALVQRKVLGEKHASTAFWFGLTSSVALAGLLILLAPSLASIFDEPGLAPIIQVMSLGLVLYALSSVPQALLEREFKFRALAGRRVLGTLLGGVSAVVAASFGMGAWALVVQTLVTAAVGVIVLWSTADWRPSFTFSWQSFRELWPVGFSVVGIELVGFANSQADKLLVGAFLDATALGYYFFAMRIISIMVELFSAVLSSISLTTFSRLQHDREQMRAWLYRLTSISCCLAMPAFAVLAAVAPEAVPLVFGEQWRESGPLVQILCVLGAINAVAVFDRSALLAVGRNRTAFLLTLGQAIVGIGLVAAALPFGVVAVAVAVSARQLIWWPVRLAALVSGVGIDWKKYLGLWLKPFVLCCFAAAAGWVLFAVIWDLSGLPIVFTIVTTLVVLVVSAALFALLLRPTLSDAIALIKQRKA